MFSFQLFNGFLPEEIASFFPKITHSHNTRSAKNNMFVGRSDPCSMKAIIPHCWNSLPLEMKKASTIATFKTKSKDSLLAPYGKFVCQLKHCPSCPAQ